MNNATSYQAVREVNGVQTIEAYCSTSEGAVAALVEARVIFARSDRTRTVRYYVVPVNAAR